MKTDRRLSRAFTIIELLVVIAIITSLTGADDEGAFDNHTLKPR